MNKFCLVFQTRSTNERLKCKAGFPLGEFVRANREKSNLIGYQPITFAFCLFARKKFAKWKTGIRHGFILSLGRGNRGGGRDEQGNRGAGRGSQGDKSGGKHSRLQARGMNIFLLSIVLFS